NCALSLPPGANPNDGDDDPVARLRRHFLAVCARPAEGVVVKGLSSPYIPGVAGTGAGFAAHHAPLGAWFKLKRDYIPGFGDSADFAVVAGRYEPEASRGFLGITKKDDASLLNVFVVACQANRGVPGAKPHFVALFTFSSGFSRAELLRFSQSTSPLRCPSPAHLKSYTLSRRPPLPPTAADEPPPAPMINTGRWDACFDPPVAVELVGGGFQPLAKGCFALRGPRYIRECGEDRGWWSTITLQEFADMARKANSPSNPAADEARLAVIDARAAETIAAPRARKRQRQMGMRESRPLLLPLSKSSSVVFGDTRVHTLTNAAGP
ncbi:hypothetical protein HK405_000579, partial [Cladochytrium tenue]